MLQLYLYLELFFNHFENKLECNFKPAVQFIYKHKINYMNAQKKNKATQFLIKLTLLIFSLFTNSSELFAESDNNDIKSKAIDGSIGLGSIIAVVASWSRNKSILWAIVHGLMGWIYVVYFIFTRED